jgi:hypothetical protein
LVGGGGKKRVFSTPHHNQGERRRREQARVTRSTRASKKHVPNLSKKQFN